MKHKIPQHLSHRMWHRIKNKFEGSFTLIELLVVIAIISLLSSIVFASTSPVRTSARDTVRVSDIRQIQNALELYYDTHQAYPTITTSASPRESVASSQDAASWNQLTSALAPYIKLPNTPTGALTDIYFYGAGGTKSLCWFGTTSIAIIHPGGYGLYSNLEKNNPGSTNDGGILDNLYESYGGNYQIIPSSPSSSLDCD